MDIVLTMLLVGVLAVSSYLDVLRLTTNSFCALVRRMCSEHALVSSADIVPPEKKVQELETCVKLAVSS